MKPHEILKIIRTEKGITTYELSELTGIPQSTISKMENGKRKIETESLTILAKALNVPVSTFFSDSLPATDEDIKNWDNYYSNLEEEFDEETRAIARDMKNLSSSKKKLLKELIKTMSESSDEELNK
ncbi:helix-turn-helix transcriptional regulator [Clostridium sp.]|uniref:helix-turn-helix domain-containing protein n=1 Tax=Clostridium sp. TaxID=1506 RepID=UPI002910DDA3|nr:helix-turn-helix transcriptional regulator [Clostridium sp.]MDU7365381.1 helix-turn-helix transcriptional regulator [Clostridium sp.]